jgi:hypothetical protein
MSISLVDLPYLIELVSRDIKNLEETINNPSTPDDIKDDSGELLMIGHRTAANLQYQYEYEWKKDSNFPSYEDLIKDIQERIVHDS